MIIRSIELHDYRNYEDLKIEFQEGTNILYGDNAQGKTNILEAAFLSGTTKSHKGSKDREIIRFEKAESHIRTIVEKGNSEYRIDLHLKRRESKGIAINGVPIKKASELFGFLNIIFFSPEDLNIIKNGPAERRHFLDAEICQLDKIYLSDLTRYNKTLAQRNRLLKEIEGNRDLLSTLSIWNTQLLQYGKRIIRRRKEFIGQLNDIVGSIHEKLTGQKEHLILKYEPDTREEDFEMDLLSAEQRDLRQLSTTVGPHRDDLLFQINDIDIRRFGSQGQQRTSALSLKLAEIELVKKTIHEAPVLLLDDVLSELDQNRQNFLLKSIGDIQTIITCTGIEDFVKNRFRIDRVFIVKEGTVEIMNGEDL